MRDEIRQILTITRLPGRLTPDQAAPLLGFNPHDLPILVRAKLLKPLGNPPQQAVKHFAASEVERCSRDESWLNRATKALYEFWAEQNRKRSAKRRQSEDVLGAA